MNVFVVLHCIGTNIAGIKHRFQFQFIFSEISAITNIRNPGNSFVSDTSHKNVCSFLTKNAIDMGISPLEAPFQALSEAHKTIKVICPARVSMGALTKSFYFL